MNTGIHQRHLAIHMGRNLKKQGKLVNAILKSNILRTLFNQDKQMSYCIIQQPPRNCHPILDS